MDFCQVGLQLLGILGRDERQLYASSSLFVFCRLWKNSNYTALDGSATIALYWEARGALGKKYLLAAKHPLGEVS